MKTSGSQDLGGHQCPPGPKVLGQILREERTFSPGLSGYSQDRASAGTRGPIQRGGRVSQPRPPVGGTLHV